MTSGFCSASTEHALLLLDNSIVSMEHKEMPLPVPMQTTANNKTKTLKKDEQYKMMFNELQGYIAAHCRTEQHHKVLDCLMEVRGLKAQDRPKTAAPRNRDKDKDVVEVDVALQQLEEKYSSSGTALAADRQKSEFNMSNDGVLR